MDSRAVGSRFLTPLIGLFFAFATLATVEAQTAPGGYGAGILGFGIRTDDLVESAALGVQGGYRSSGGVLFMGEYLYLGRDFYYFDFDDERIWKRADSWSSVPSPEADINDWLFTRSRHMLGAAAGFSGVFGPAGLYGAGGLALSWLSVSDAEDEYPEFGEAARQSSLGDSGVLVTPTIRGGMVVPANSVIAAQVSYMLMLERGDDSSELGYVRRNSLLYIGLVVQPGAES
ncbi:MAG: hypothetical protein ACOC0B_01925 [bacterium]